MQEDSSTSPSQEPLFHPHAQPLEDTQEEYEGKTHETSKAIPFFSVIEKVTFKPMAATPERGARHLSPTVARLASLVSLSAVVLWPLSGCGSTGDNSVPCPVPTSTTTGTPVPEGTPQIKCTSSSGTHYFWIPSRGGWVPSDDGIHPNPNAHGVGEDDGHGGVGGGHGGSGHGGGDGG